MDCNIKATVEMDLCVSCGLCRITCPVGAIQFILSKGQHLPHVSNKCKICGQCLYVCPGYQVTFGELYDYEERDKPENFYTGHCIKSNVCYTKDENIRKNSASGGMITSLILELLEKKIYQGAFVLHNFIGKEMPKLSYTEKANVVISASKSKYIPVSVENAALSIDKLRSSIVVGTPCQIHGLKKYCVNNNLESSNILFLGLFCEKTLNMNLIKFYEWRYRKSEEIVSFEYKNKERDGWPGHTKISFKDREAFFVHRGIRLMLKSYFQLSRCLYYIDKLNQLADISFGDCYIKNEEDRLGKSNIIVRTQKAKELLEYVKDAFVMYSIDKDNIFDSQNINEKKKNLIFCDFILKQKKRHLYPDLQREFNYPSAYIKQEENKKDYDSCLELIELGKYFESFPLINHRLSLPRECKHLTNKKIIIFGAGSKGQELASLLSNETAYFVDNARSKWGTIIWGKIVKEPGLLLEEDRESIAILVASDFFIEISLQLINMGFIENKNFFNFMLERIKSEEYYGNIFHCPFCEGTFSKLKPGGLKNDVLKTERMVGAGYRLNAVCPICGSSDRERLVYLFLKERAHLFKAQKRFLHIAPERNIKYKLLQAQNIDYISGDICPEKAGAVLKVDVTKMQFKSNEFDFIVCNHVLEHVVDDKTALKEIHRVLKPGGKAVLQVPISLERKKTFEDQSIEKPVEREQAFGQHDHVRIYAMDYIDRIETAGFKVKVLNAVEVFGAELIYKYGLIKEEKLFYCEKEI